MTTATSQFNRRILELAIRGERPRCADPIDHQRWTSESPADRAAAAPWCAGCVVLTLCDAAATERGEKYGVWAGIDRTRR
jgi:hypothetical protein